ncbi:putative non-specific serine/threonine protein kinase [Helianthus annuus]|nr:putative non-specific serine/threonine protein kinase [Helianthus annuus]
MTNNICHNLLYLVSFSLSLFLLWLRNTSATSLGHQLVAAGGGDGNYKCIDKERHTLLHFKAHVHQDFYGLLSTWATKEEATNDCCKWSGVTCNNQTGHVTSLDLFSGDLEGELSPSLLNLSYLNHLDLSGNQFEGTIPHFIGSLTKLRYLDISWNDFSGSIPIFVGSMTRLRYLRLSDNQFEGTIPHFIGSLTKLRYLDISWNYFSGNIPMFISSMTQLRYLRLSSNSFNGTIPLFIGSMTQLRHLDLSDNYFHGTIPLFIGSMIQLRHLDLSYNFFNGTVPLEFGNMTNLQNLYLGYLGGCAIKSLDWLSRLPQLGKLDMSGISLAKENHWVNVILSLHNLSYLKLRGCGLSHVMRPFYSSVNSSSSSIVSLHIGNNNLNSSLYHWLFELTSNRLLNLDLSRNKLDGIPRYLGNLCSLTSLDFRNNHIAFKFPDFLYNLSGCTSVTLQQLYVGGNQFTGSLPDDIQNFPSLVSLDLSNNQLNETISEKVWELPKLQYLDFSSNFLRCVISENIEKSKIMSLRFSNNSLEGYPSDDYMSNLSYIESVYLSSCKLGPKFPKWIPKLKKLSYLDISNTSISDTIPQEFWNMRPSHLRYFDISSNNITGKVTNLLSNFDSEPVGINLSSNNFYGPIGNVPSTLTTLDLSKNKFYGEISFLCQIAKFQTVCGISHTVLNLGQNNLFGRLPSSIEYLINLEVLYLYNNNFSGELPLSLRNCTKLSFLELRGNKFSGCVPSWIGEKLSMMYLLSLTSNNFFGTIPVQLCQLVNLQILELSMNNLYGTIPPMPRKVTSEYIDYAIINWQGIVREFRSTLGLVKSIDLSSNNLTGSIPCELADLHGLIALNLSMNALRGEIPPKIGLMKNLLQLDLSRNNLSGQIPTSMSQMTSIDYLDVSYNNLSGRIPSSTQLQSFEPSKYTGNGLCGPPLTKYCPGDEEKEIPHVVGQTEGGGEGMNELEIWFYIGGATGFATGFWIVCGALLVNRHGRNAFFHFFDSLKDWVYVKAMVFIAKWQQVAHA